MTTKALKYPRVEYERRFLVAHNSKWRNYVESYSKRYEDSYLRQSRLRVRKLTDLDTGRQVIKLTKKFESPSPYFQTNSRIILSELEYNLFDKLESDDISKVRYYHNYENSLFSIDVFEGELTGLILCEHEAESLQDLMIVTPPDYVISEVTEDTFFTGGNLSRIKHTELMHKLSGYL